MEVGSACGGVHLGDKASLTLKRYYKSYSRRQNKVPIVYRLTTDL